MGKSDDVETKLRTIEIKIERAKPAYGLKIIPEARIGILKKNKVRPSTTCSGWSPNIITMVRNKMKSSAASDPETKRLIRNIPIFTKRKTKLINHSIGAAAGLTIPRKPVSRVTMINPNKIIFSNRLRRASSGSEEVTFSSREKGESII